MRKIEFCNPLLGKKPNAVSVSTGKLKEVWIFAILSLSRKENAVEFKRAGCSIRSSGKKNAVYTSWLSNIATELIFNLLFKKNETSGVYTCLVARSQCALWKKNLSIISWGWISNHLFGQMKTWSTYRLAKEELNFQFTLQEKMKCCIRVDWQKRAWIFNPLFG